MGWGPIIIVGIIVWGAVAAYKAKLGIVADEDGNETRIAAAAPIDDGETKAEIKQLKERVQVLERLVTDRSYDLAGEIEALRASSDQSGDPLNIKTQEKA